MDQRASFLTALAATALRPQAAPELVDGTRQTWRTPGRVRQRAAVDWDARQFRVRIGGRIFIGIDPKHGRQGAPALQPLVLDNARILSPTLAAPRS